MTATRDAIDAKLSLAWNDWAVTSSEMAAVLALLRADGLINATINDQDASGGLMRMMLRITNIAYLRELVAVLAARTSTSKATVSKAIESARRTNPAFRNA